jgi:hypothetical protein
MPRNVRNFWIELQVDGKATKVGTGPVSKDGGFDLEILMRNRGEIERPIRIMGIAREDGSLELIVLDRKTPGKTEIKTKR